MAHGLIQTDLDVSFLRVDVPNTDEGFVDLLGDDLLAVGIVGDG